MEQTVRPVGQGDLGVVDLMGLKRFGHQKGAG